MVKEKHTGRQEGCQGSKQWELSPSLLFPPGRALEGAVRIGEGKTSQPHNGEYGSFLRNHLEARRGRCAELDGGLFFCFCFLSVHGNHSLGLFLTLSITVGSSSGEKSGNIYQAGPGRVET